MGLSLGKVLSTFVLLSLLSRPEATGLGGGVGGLEIEFVPRLDSCVVVRPSVRPSVQGINAFEKGDDEEEAKGEREKKLWRETKKV